MKLLQGLVCVDDHPEVLFHGVELWSRNRKYASVSPAPVYTRLPMQPKLAAVRAELIGLQIRRLYRDGHAANSPATR